MLPALPVLPIVERCQDGTMHARWGGTYRTDTRRHVRHETALAAPGTAGQASGQEGRHVDISTASRHDLWQPLNAGGECT